MDGDRRLAYGLGLAFLGYAWAGALFVTAPGAGLFSYSMATVALGLGVATGGALLASRTMRTLGLGVATLAYLVIVSIGTQAGNWFEVGHAASLVGFGVLAWASAGGAQAGRWQLGWGAVALAAVVYVVLLLNGGSWNILPAPLLALAGSALAGLAEPAIPAGTAPARGSAR